MNECKHGRPSIVACDACSLDAERAARLAAEAHRDSIADLLEREHIIRLAAEARVGELEKVVRRLAGMGETECAACGICRDVATEAIRGREGKP